MTRAVIVSTARTPLARSWKGSFNITHGATLAAHAVAHAVARAGNVGVLVEDVVLGCANPEGATGMNIARQAALRAGLSVEAAGMTVNRFCSSGLEDVKLGGNRAARPRGRNRNSGPEPTPQAALAGFPGPDRIAGGNKDFRQMSLRE